MRARTARRTAERAIARQGRADVRRGRPVDSEASDDGALDPIFLDGEPSTAPPAIRRAYRVATLLIGRFPVDVLDAGEAVLSVMVHDATAPFTGPGPIVHVRDDYRIGRFEGRGWRAMLGERSAVVAAARRLGDSDTATTIETLGGDPRALVVVAADARTGDYRIGRYRPMGKGGVS